MPSQPTVSERPATDLRAVHARRTRGAIRAAAGVLTRDKGYAAMTVDDVAEMAGVSRRTVFNHFPCKSDMLIVGPVPPEPEALDAFAAGQGPVLDDLRLLLRDGIASLESEREVFRTMGPLIRDNPELKNAIHARVRDYVDAVRGAAARRLETTPADVRARALADLAGMIQRAAVDLWAGFPDDAPVAAQLADGAGSAADHASTAGTGSEHRTGENSGTHATPGTAQPVDGVEGASETVSLADAIETVVAALKDILGLPGAAVAAPGPARAAVPVVPAIPPEHTTPAAPAGTITPATTKEHA